MMSHDTSAVAVHWHSRAVSTVTEPLPPADPIVVAVAPTVTAHRAGPPEGLVTVAAEPPQAAGSAAAASNRER